MYFQFWQRLFVHTNGLHIGGSYGKKTIIDGKSCILEVLFDTDRLDGYYRLRLLRDQWIRDGDAFMLNYCITERSSFDRIRLYHNQISRVKELLASSPSYPGSPMSGPCQQDCPLVLVGSNDDRVSEREVSTEEGYALAKELGCEFFEFSAKSCISIETPFYEIVRQLRRRQRLQARVARRRLRETRTGAAA
jgi:GTPase KRas